MPNTLPEGSPEQKRAYRRFVALYLSMIVTIVLAIGLATYTASWQIHQQREQDAKNAAAAMEPVCQFLKSYIDVYKETPPTTPTGKSLEANAVRLYIEFGCKNA